MTRCVSVLVLIAIAVPLRAHAGARAEARSHMTAATKLHGEGKFSEALGELTTAYSLDPRPEILYAIAQTHVQLGNCPQAITFYERFLSTRPPANAAAATREAIETCAARATVTAPAAPAPVPLETLPATQPPDPPRIEQPPGAPRWYADPLGLGLASGGVALGVAAVIAYRVALGDLDRAEAATDYERHAELVDRAHGKRAIAAVLAIGGAGLIGAGIARLVIHHRHVEQRRLAIAPAAGGAVVTWSGRF